MSGSRCADDGGRRLRRSSGAGWRTPTLLVATLKKLYVWPGWPVNVAEVSVVFIWNAVERAAVVGDVDVVVGDARAVAVASRTSSR